MLLFNISIYRFFKMSPELLLDLLLNFFLPTTKIAFANIQITSTCFNK